MSSIRFCFPKFDDQGEDNTEIAVSLVNILMLEYKFHCLTSESRHHYYKEHGQSFSLEHVPCLIVDAYRSDITQEMMDKISQLVNTILLKDVGSQHPILVTCHAGAVSLLRSDYQALSKTA
jgi:hypothetical protein